MLDTPLHVAQLKVSFVKLFRFTCTVFFVYFFTVLFRKCNRLNILYYLFSKPDLLLNYILLYFLKSTFSAQ